MSSCRQIEPRFAVTCPIRHVIMNSSARSSKHRMHRKQALHCRNRHRLTSRSSSSASSFVSSSSQLSVSASSPTASPFKSGSSLSFTFHLHLLSLLLFATAATCALKLSNYEPELLHRSNVALVSNAHQSASLVSTLQTDFRELQDKRLADHHPFGALSAFDSGAAHDAGHIRRSLELPERVVRRNVARPQPNSDELVARSVGVGRSDLAGSSSNELLETGPNDQSPSISAMPVQSASPALSSSTSPTSTASTASASSTAVERGGVFNKKDNLVDEQEVDRTQVNNRIKDTIEWNEPSSESNRNNTLRPPKQFELATFDFEHVSTPYVISLWIIIVGLAKIGFHVTPKLSSICPESVVLMVLGVLIGFIFFYGGMQPGSSRNVSSIMQPLTPNLFFLYMLPPIVMDAGYHMPNRLFFDNLCSITLYAVLGTVWNALTIGLALYACSEMGWFGVQLPLLDTFLFSSIVSAVDPVAVLAVFEEVHVNEVLYILVFGESLLNDAVTVVLYHMFETYSEMGLENLQLLDYLIGFLSFFVVSLGGTLMGVVWGFGTAYVSRFTHHVKIIEPIFVFVMAYLSYLSAEMFHLSGILSLTFCGITMKNYVEENITSRSHTTLKYAMKMLANSSESIIFLFLGVCTVNDSHDWNTLFVVLTIVFCLVFRTIGVIIFTAIANRFRLHKLSGIEQFIMSYGGLRGAVAFALVLVINENVIPTKKMMITTVIALVYFTVFLQGMTVGPLVNILKVPRSNKYELTMNERIHTRFMDHVMAGIEDISGMMVGNYKIRDKFRRYNNLYLKHWFLRDSHVHHNTTRKIFETHSRLNLQDAMRLVSKQSLFDLYTNNEKMITPSKSLSALFRTYTQANLSSIQEDIPMKLASLNLPLGSPSEFNFDLANLEYSPSHKDLADAEIHHILNDAMFTPIKRYRKYSKCDLLDQPTGARPPFQHQMRMQIRHLVSQNRFNRRRYRKKVNGASTQHSDRNNAVMHNLSDSNLCRKVKTTSFNNTNNAFVGQTAKQTFGNFVHSNRPDADEAMANQKRLQAQNSLGNESEDAGITFTARSHANGGSMSSSKHPSSFKGSPDKCSTVGSKSPDETSQTSKQTIAETMLPWRRNSTLRRSSGSGSVTGTAISGSTTGAAAVGSSTSGTNTTGGSFDSQSSVTGLSTGPLKQEEFPPWINNKEYLIGYCSPTNTILRNIDLSKQNTRMPTVHEIFSINGSEGQLNTGSTNPDLESGDYRRRSQPIIGSPASQAFASTASASAAPMPPPPPLPTLPPNATSTPVLSTFAPVQHAPFRTGSGTRFNITLSSQALDQRTLAGDDLSSVQVVDGSQSTDNIRLDLQEDPNTHPIYRL